MIFWVARQVFQARRCYHVTSKDEDILANVSHRRLVGMSVVRCEYVLANFEGKVMRRQIDEGAIIP